MMKSFFKKLSLVMALAMVVSMMAPAASAFAADLIIAGQEEAKADAKESYSVAVDDEVDFKFYGAAAGWQDLYKWESSDETIAKPLVNEKGEQDGRFEGLKDGKVEVTLTIGEQKATVELVVGKGEVVVDNSFEVKQTAGDKVTITWADATKATTNVELYKIYNLTSGAVEVKWPCEVTVKDGVATVDAYVPFADGEEYVLKFGEEKVGFVAYVGKISKIVVVPKDIATNGTTLYACSEEPYRPIRFDVEFITDGGIKVAQPEGTSMYYEVITADDNVEVDNFGESSYITSVGATAVVKAIYYYEENGETKELTDEFVIVGQAVPVANFDGVAGFAINAYGTETKNVSWNKAEIIYGEEAYVSLKFADTLGGVYYTDNLTLGEKEAYLPGSFGEITYMSSDESKLLIGEYDGKVTAIGSDGSAVVIVKLTYTVGENTVTKNVYAFEVALKSERKADRVNATGTTVLVDDNADGNLAASGKITFTVVDQYGTAWTDWEKAEITTTLKDAPALTITQDEDKDGNLLGSGTIAVDGSLFKSVVSKGSVTYTINIDGAKTPVKVTLKNPPLAAGSTSVMTGGYLVEATGTDVDGTKDGTIKATISAYTTWSNNGIKYKVGYVPADKLVAYNHKDFWTKNATNLEAGSIVVLVQKPNNEFIVPTIDATSGAISVPVAEVASGSALNIAATGTYTVTLYKVTSTTKNDDGTYKINKLSQAETTFAVNNKCANMSISFDTNQALKSDASSIEQVIVDLATFKLGKDDYTMVAADIVDVDGVYNDSADKYYVKSIKVKTPVGKTGAYFEETLTIGKTFEVPGMPDAE